jgi:Trk K+ transport system NAD-binding subunit
MTQETLVIGGGPIGLHLATELAAQDHDVAVVDVASMVSRARETGLSAYESTLETARPNVDCSAMTVIVATPSDARNLLLATAAPRAFDAERVIALVNDPDRLALFDAAGIETLCVSRAIAAATVDAMTVDDPLSVGDSTTEDRTPETTDRTVLRE